MSGTGQWEFEIEYLSAQRKATTGQAILRNEKGEYVGKVYAKSAQQIVEAVNKSLKTYNDPTDNAFREAAKEQYVREGTVEIDGGCIVSVSDDGGAYVAAWVWVEDSDIPEELRPERIGDEQTKQ